MANFTTHIAVGTVVSGGLAVVTLAADVVASLGAAPFAMDTLGVDVAVGASQKGLMCPPGVGFVAVNAAAFAQAERNPSPRYYWDWRPRKSELSYRKFCGTPPQNLLLGMEAALGLIFILVTLFLPQGVVGLVQKLRQRWLGNAA